MRLLRMWWLFPGRMRNWLAIVVGPGIEGRTLWAILLVSMCR